ncbi:hypothetical protein PAAG_03265 [Paracoccidioides lutzii Pb01]|uniref:Uncharacterized protein n=1 Tax=Paracoccidioides lutzii (strain ATCC MYA-826 / Pb01) TaxID=502779 RepID=C1GXY2_PARBA|nr:hypothetical protein PAAG_03265 [Paracoccidioides lutzii Pb01]EEH41702.2 hypothetical protein PAAG_03265 [Paracoccidioides lutzii Pb01]
MSRLNLGPRLLGVGPQERPPTSLEGFAILYLPRPDVELVDQLLSSRDQITFRLPRRVVAPSFHKVPAHLLIIFLDHHRLKDFIDQPLLRYPSTIFNQYCQWWVLALGVALDIPDTDFPAACTGRNEGNWDSIIVIQTRSSSSRMMGVSGILRIHASIEGIGHLGLGTPTQHQLICEPIPPCPRQWRADGVRSMSTCRPRRWTKDRNLATNSRKLRSNVDIIMERAKIDAKIELPLPVYTPR